jgi:hypothetical protein
LKCDLVREHNFSYVFVEDEEDLLKAPHIGVVELRGMESSNVLTRSWESAKKCGLEFL